MSKQKPALRYWKGNWYCGIYLCYKAKTMREAYLLWTEAPA